MERVVPFCNSSWIIISSNHATKLHRVFLPDVILLIEITLLWSIMERITPRDHNLNRVDYPGSSTTRLQRTNWHCLTWLTVDLSGQLQIYLSFWKRQATGIQRGLWLQMIFSLILACLETQLIALIFLLLAVLINREILSKIMSSSPSFFYFLFMIVQIRFYSIEIAQRWKFRFYLFSTCVDAIL